jgi:hypothetical protein
MLARLEELFEERREADKQIVANYMPTNYGH